MPITVTRTATAATPGNTRRIRWAVSTGHTSLESDWSHQRPPARTGPRSVQVLARAQNAPPVFGLSSRAARWERGPARSSTGSRSTRSPAVSSCSPRVVMEPVSYWPSPESARSRRPPGPDARRRDNRDHDRRMPSASRRSGTAALPGRMRSRWDAGQHRPGRVDRRHCGRAGRRGAGDGVRCKGLVRAQPAA